MSLQYKPVQSYFGKKAAGFLSRELNAQISIEGLYFKPFTSLQLRQLYVSDQSGDTLFYAGGLEASFDLASLLQNQLSIDRVHLSDAQFQLQIDQEGHPNLDFLIDYFAPAKERKERKKLKLDLRRIELQNLSFHFLDHRKAADNVADLRAHRLNPPGQGAQRPAIDFDDLELRGISGILSDIDFSPAATTLRIQKFTLREKSGFHLHNLDTRAHIATGMIELRELDLQTNKSEIRDYVLLSFSDFSDFNDFVHKVEVQLELDKSRIASSDIAYFAPAMHDIQFDAGISGSLKGTVSAIQGRQIVLNTSPHTQLQGQLSIMGLPEINQTIFDVDISHLTTNTHEVEQLVPQLSPHTHFELPDLLDRLEQLHFQGTFRGHYDDFAVRGQLRTALGELDTDMTIKLQEGSTGYKGTIHTQEFDLGQLVQTPPLGKMGFHTFVDGSGFAPADRNLALNAQVQYLDFNQYRYTNLKADASLIGDELRGNINITDPHLRMSLEGYSSINPNSIVHDLQATVFYADLRNTRLYTQDSLVLHAAEVHSVMKGHDFNDLQGKLHINHILFESGAGAGLGTGGAGTSGRQHIGSLQVRAEGTGPQRHIDLQSDMVDASLTGQVDFYKLGSYFRGMAGRYLPSLGLPSSDPGEQDFRLDLRIRDFAPVAGFISPAFSIADSSLFSGHFSSLSSQQDGQGAFPTTQETSLLTSFQIRIPSLTLGPVQAQDLRIAQRADHTQLQVDLEARNLLLYETNNIHHLEISQILEQDKLSYQIQLADTTGQHQANLLGHLLFHPDQRISIHSDPSRLLLNGEQWLIAESNATFYKNRTHLEGLVFSNQQQRIQVDGYISVLPDDRLNLTFDQFDVSTINPLIPNFNFRIGGQLQGKTSINSLLSKPYATADLQFRQISLDQTLLGDLVANADFDQDRNRINLALALNKENKQSLFVGGVYHIGQTGDNLDLLARFDQTDLKVLQVLLKDLISDVQGNLTGQATITGTLSKLNINGSGRLNEAGFTVNYLQTPYRANGPLSMKNTAFIIDDLTLTDPRGQQARANGRIDMQKPANPHIQATINTNNFLVLRTNFRDNPLYYGTAYGTGRFQFDGTPESMNITINARTEENTVLHIPLNTAASLGNYEFIRFTTSGAGDQPTPQSNNTPAGLRLNMDLQVTPAATTNIHTDLGELSGRGEGQIALRITSMGDFEMFGDYSINSGKFTFSAQDFINKIFEIKQGGNIRWTGKPTDASIALTAFYEQRTSLSPLYDAAGRTTNEQRVTARAEMELSGNLMRPGINFGLDFPADPYVKDELQSYLSDANNVNQQALSLIVRRSFSPGSTTDLSQEINSTLLSAGTELAFNQLNNLISQSLNLNFIDFNIRSLNDASASFRFFNDRLIFTGGITDLRNQRLNDLNVFSRERIATDAELLYLIRKDGRLVLRGSNRLNTRHFLLNPTDEYISALGLIYRREFDSFSEFFRKRK